MIHLIPHQTELLKITAFQKSLISQLQDKDSILIQTIPLWIPVPDNYNQLKNFSDSIKKVSLDLPQLSDDFSSIFSTVTIETSAEKIITTLQLIDFYKTNADSEKRKDITLKLKKICTEQNLFPCTLKIFRAASTVEFSENSKAIETAVWKKLKDC